jgi:hypothetical protein
MKAIPLLSKVTMLTLAMMQGRCNITPTKVLTKDEIWKTNLTVWNGLPSSSIASGFVQASHIAKKVIKQNSDDSFCEAQGRTSTKFWRDFNETRWELSCKDHKKLLGLIPPKRQIEDSHFIVY